MTYKGHFFLYISKALDSKVLVIVLGMEIYSETINTLSLATICLTCKLISELIALQITFVITIQLHVYQTVSVILLEHFN
ncbi:hypothetical protein CQA01_03970 [Cyclobacterium qasimii]|uniref:Uncharacterized protein n=1 Tax=Cyclobacterium qasimii TaxID=1350429 RepID=A0A512C6M5_9BACT|nr:hypothetical protein CQA01_03970 [Cyclobacterium qasimii]